MVKAVTLHVENGISSESEKANSQLAPEYASNWIQSILESYGVSDVRDFPCEDCTGNVQNLCTIVFLINTGREKLF